MTGKHGVRRSQLAWGDLVVPCFDVDRYEPPIVFAREMRTDVALEDLLTTPGGFFTAIARSPTQSIHVASIQYPACGTAMVTEVVEIAGTDSPEPEQCLRMACPQTVVGDDPIFIHLEITRLDLDHDDLPLILGTHLRGDVALVDLLAEARQFLVGVTRASSHGGHIASIRYADETRLLPLRPDREQLGLAMVSGGDAVFAGPAGGAVAVAGAADGGEHAVEREIGEAVRLDVLADLLQAVAGRDQLVAGGGVDPVVAGPLGRRRGDAHVYLGGPAVPDHAHDLARGGSAHDRVVYQHHPAAGQQLPDRVELDLHPEIP